MRCRAASSRSWGRPKVRTKSHPEPAGRMPRVGGSSQGWAKRASAMQAHRAVPAHRHEPPEAPAATPSATRARRCSGRLRGPHLGLQAQVAQAAAHPLVPGLPAPCRRVDHHPPGHTAPEAATTPRSRAAAAAVRPGRRWGAASAICRSRSISCRQLRTKSPTPSPFLPEQVVEARPAAPTVGDRGKARLGGPGPGQPGGVLVGGQAHPEVRRPGRPLRRGGGWARPRARRRPAARR